MGLGGGVDVQMHPHPNILTEGGESPNQCNFMFYFVPFVFFVNQ